MLLVYKTLCIRLSEATRSIADTGLQRQFRLAYAHIWYGDSNTVYSEGVRAVTTYPPPLGCLPILRTGPSTGVYGYYSIKKMWGYTISCVCCVMHILQIYKVLEFQCFCCYNYSDNLHNGNSSHMYIQAMHC